MYRRDVTFADECYQASEFDQRGGSRQVIWCLKLRLEKFYDGMTEVLAVNEYAGCFHKMRKGGTQPPS